jgi:catechol 2,3-dioxygenase-like lactoylglutathione lyase family enzyme
MGRPQEAFPILRLGHCVLRVRDLSAARSFSIDVLGFVPALEERDALSVRGITDFDLWTLGLVRLDEPGLDHFALRWSTPTISMHSGSCTAHSASQSLGSRQGESQAKGKRCGFARRTGIRWSSNTTWSKCQSTTTAAACGSRCGRLIGSGVFHRCSSTIRTCVSRIPTHHSPTGGLTFASVFRSTLSATERPSRRGCDEGVVRTTLPWSVQLVRRFTMLPITSVNRLT